MDVMSSLSLSLSLSPGHDGGRDLQVQRQGRLQQRAHPAQPAEAEVLRVRPLGSESDRAWNFLPACLIAFIYFTIIHSLSHSQPLSPFALTGERECSSGRGVVKRCPPDLANPYCIAKVETFQNGSESEWKLAEYVHERDA